MADNITNTKEQSWIEAYVEISDLIDKKIKECLWVDLWSGQTDTPWESLPFPVPATFIGMDVVEVSDNGDESQDLLTDVTLYHVYETYGDTEPGGFARNHALGFGRFCQLHHQLLHGTNGKHFSDLTRVGLKQRQSAIGSVMVYEQTYRTIIRDYSANPELEEVELTFNQPEPADDPTPTEPFYNIPTT